MKARARFVAAVAAATVILSSNGATAQDQLALACSGKQVVENLSKGTRAVKKWRITYILDLSHNIWCSVEKCVGGPIAITKYDEASITLVDLGYAFPDSTFRLKDTIDRRTGHFHGDYRLDDEIGITDGECTKMPFGGFPARRGHASNRP